MNYKTETLQYVKIQKVMSIPADSTATQCQLDPTCRLALLLGMIISHM